MAGESESKGSRSISPLPAILEEVSEPGSSETNPASPRKRSRSIAFGESIQHQEEDLPVRFPSRPSRRSRRQAFYFNPNTIENDPENNLLRHLVLDEWQAPEQPGAAEKDVPTGDLKAIRINTLLSTNIFWSSLSEEVKTTVSKEFVMKQFGMGETILAKGRNTAKFHVVESGTLTMGDKVFKEGDVFGEMTLIQGNFEAADNVVAGDNLKLWVIPGAMYRYIQSKIYKKNLKEAGGTYGDSEETTHTNSVNGSQQ